MPSVTAFRPGSARGLFVSKAKESAYGTAQTLAYQFLHALDWDPFDVEAMRIPDTDYSSGNPSDFERRHFVEGKRFQADLNVWASLEAMAIALAKAAGNDTTSLISGSVYKHLITPGDQPQYLPGWTLQENRYGASEDNDVDVKVCGNCCDSWEFKWTEKGIATLALGIKGSGRTAAVTDIDTADPPTGITRPTAFLTNDKIRTLINAAAGEGDSSWDGNHTYGATAGAFATAPTGIATDISHLVTDGSIKWSNGVGDERVGGTSSDSGYYAGQPIGLARTLEVALTIRHDSGVAALEALVKSLSGSSFTNQNEFTIAFDFAGHTNNVYGQLILPVAVLLENPSGGSGKGPQTYKYRFGARKELAAANNKIFSAAFNVAEALSFA